MNTYMLKSIHFTECSVVCRLQEERYMTVTNQELLLSLNLLLGQQIENISIYTTRHSKLLYIKQPDVLKFFTLCTASMDPFKPCGKISYSYYNVYSLLMKNQEDCRLLGFDDLFISLLLPLIHQGCLQVYIRSYLKTVSFFIVRKPKL